MAVKIIDEVPHKSVVKQTICRNCGVTLQYVPMDVKKQVTRDIDGGSDHYYFIDCPKCSERVIVR